MNQRSTIHKDFGLQTADIPLQGKESNSLVLERSDAFQEHTVYSLIVQIQIGMSLQDIDYNCLVVLDYLLPDMTLAGTYCNLPQKCYQSHSEIYQHYKEYKLMQLSLTDRFLLNNDHSVSCQLLFDKTQQCIDYRT
jgi:hypothetical protein